MSALNNLGPKAVFGSRKSIFGKYSIFRKCYFPERKTFSCVWLSQNSFYGKLISVFGSFKHFYRKCIKFGKRNKTQQKKMNQIRRRRRWDRTVKATASGGEVDDCPTSGARPTSALVERAARSMTAPRDLVDHDRAPRRSQSSIALLVGRSHQSRFSRAISSSPPLRDPNFTGFDEFFCWILFLLWMSVELIHYLHVYSWGSVWKIGHVKHFL